MLHLTQWRVILKIHHSEAHQRIGFHSTTGPFYHVNEVMMKVSQVAVQKHEAQKMSKQ